MSRDLNVVEKVIASLRNIGNFELSPLREAKQDACFRAVDAGRRISVSIRTLWPSDLPNSEQHFEQLRTQARAAQNLEHGNIAKVIGSGELDGSFFIVSSFADGKSLRQNLSSGDPLSPWDLIDFARQTCVGLESAHSRGVIHHALHPDNIVLQFDGSTKLLDIGLYRANHPESDAFHANAVYLAPEQFTGHNADRSTNFYSVAIMLYEIATGKRPFNGDSWDAVRLSTQQDFPAPVEVNASVPPGISAAIMKALSRDRAARFQSGPEMVRAIEDYKSFGKPEVPVVAPPPPPKPPSIGIASSSMAAAAPAPIRNPFAPAPDLAHADLSSLINPKQVGFEKPVMVGLQESVPRKPSTPAVAPALEVEEEIPAFPVQPSKVKVAGETALRLARQGSSSGFKLIKKVDPWVATLAFLGLTVCFFIARTVALSFWPTSRQVASVESAPAPASIAPLPEAPAPAAPTAEQPDTNSDANIAPDTTVIYKQASPDRRASRKLLAASNSLKLAKARLLPDSASTATLTGSVIISSVPAGAQVVVDGKSNQGYSTPEVIPLAPGPHTLTLTKDGYSPASRPVQITAGAQSKVTVQLELPSALLTVQSNPTSAYILIDGVSTGHVTPSQVNVSPGSHTLTLRKMGYVDSSDSVSLKPGDQQSRSLTLLEAGSTSEIRVAQNNGVRKLFGNKVSGTRLSVHTNPAGATVVINGQTVTKSTPVDFGLNPGNYGMEIRLEGYQTLHKTITVEQGKPLTFDETLHP